MPDKAANLIRIGVFYDGNYFLHVSNYYNYSHERRSRIAISGLHGFIRKQVADAFSTDERLCQIVDAHYFRGRLNAHEASQRGNQLFYDRLFDDILMSEGVVTHYLPVKSYGGARHEKGIDVWLALEAFELAFYKRFDVVVLITADGDYIPLARKLNTLGARVVVLSWDFEYLTDEGERMVTRTSQDLLAEVSYPIAMHGLIDNGLRQNDPVIQELFVKQLARPDTQPRPSREQTLRIYTNGNELNGNGEHETNGQVSDETGDEPPVGQTGEAAKTSTIRTLKNGYGFINFPPNNLFFHHTSLRDIDFNELQVDDEVAFRVGQNPDGKDIAVDVRLLAL